MSNASQTKPRPRFAMLKNIFAMVIVTVIICGSIGLWLHYRASHELPCSPTSTQEVVVRQGQTNDAIGQSFIAHGADPQAFTACLAKLNPLDAHEITSGKLVAGTLLKVPKSPWPRTHT